MSVLNTKRLPNFDDLTTPLTIVHLTSDNRLMLIKADRVYAHFLKSSQSEKWAHFKASSPSLSHARPDLHYIELGLLEPLQNNMLAKKSFTNICLSDRRALKVLNESKLMSKLV